jgi:hypothetical protein
MTRTINHVHSTPPTKAPVDYGDLGDTLERAVHMSSIAVTLMEKAFNVYEHYGDKEYHEKRRQEGRSCETYLIHDQDEDTLLFSLYEAHAQTRAARDLYCGTPDDDAPEQADANGRAVQS